MNTGFFQFAANVLRVDYDAAADVCRTKLAARDGIMYCGFRYV